MPNHFSAGVRYEKGRQAASGKFTKVDGIAKRSVKDFMTNPVFGPVTSEAPSEEPPSSPFFPGDTGNVKG